MTKIKHSCLLGLLALVCLSPVFAVSCNDKIICPDCVTLPSVSITLLETDDWSQCRVRFTPSEGTERFIYYIGQEEELSAFENGTLEGVDTLNTCKEQEVIFYDLELKKEYCIFARAYDGIGNAGGTAVERFFNGTDIRISSQYVTATSAGIRISLNDAWYGCRYYLGTPSEKESFMSGEMEGAYLLEKNEYVVNRFDLQPATEYVLYVLPENRMGVEYELMEYGFVTPEKGAAADITLEFPVRNVYEITARMTPNRYCSKLSAAIFTDGGESDFSSFLGRLGVYGGDVAKLFENIKSVSSYNGNPLDATMSGILTCSRTLYLAVAMYDTAGELVGVQYHSYSTPEFDSSYGEATASVEILQTVNGGSDWGDRHSFKSIITPNEETMGYFVKWMEAGSYNRILAEQEDPDTYIRNSLVKNFDQFVYGNYPIAYTKDRLAHYQTEICIVVCPFNGNGIEGWGPITAHFFEIK